jgi:hypothetical protein
MHHIIGTDFANAFAARVAIARVVANLSAGDRFQIVAVVFM